ncbi:MAG TPA: ribonuclease R [Steroidobacteraceae bacterium]|nr:ribonuclease R [Steroidobacteraceae bacterium]
MYATGPPEVNETGPRGLNSRATRRPCRARSINRGFPLKKSRPPQKSRHPNERGGPSRPRPPQFGGSRSRRGAPPGGGATRTLTGIVSANRAGFGFVRGEGLTESVFLPPREMSGLMHGDQVRISAQQGGDGRWSGELIEILARGTGAFLATVDIRGRSISVQSADRRLNLHCTVAPVDLNGAVQGSWVIARILQYPEPGGSGVARVERLLDPDKPVTLATEAAIAKLNLPREFPPEAVRDATVFGHAIDPREAAQRVDLRSLPLVTIDGEDAKDFDDAVYADATAHGFRLIVAIADVSHYVREGTTLDEEARKRGTSVYFPGRVVPMLPPVLSDELCSLQPNVDRLCLVADMEISRTGNLGNAKFYPAVMRSQARLTYNQAFAALFEGRPEARAQIGPLCERLMPLLDVYRALLNARHKRGALDFDAPEPKFRFNTAEQITAIDLPLRNDAHKLIEECMVLANVATARELAARHRPTLYRVHAPPDERKLDILVTTLAALGIGVELPAEITTRDLQKIAPRIKDPAARPFIETLIVRSMMQAQYTPGNLGHFGLALKQYAHFTSPIRRYPDLVVHRTIKAMLTANDPAGRAYEATELEMLGVKLTDCEKRADEADRYVDAYLKCIYLRDRIGQTFDAIITSVVDFGCFVQIIEAAADGLLHLDNLRDDEYVKDDALQAWVGVRNKRRLQLGTHVRVIVTSVNPVEGLIDLDLVPDPAVSGKGNAPGSRRR